MNSNISSAINIQSILAKAEQKYETLRSKLEPSQNGKYIAIEGDSGNYFIGETREEAVNKAKQKYPKSVVFVRRIGSLEKVARHSPPYISHTSYARIF